MSDGSVISMLIKKKCGEYGAIRKSMKNANVLCECPLSGRRGYGVVTVLKIFGSNAK